MKIIDSNRIPIIIAALSFFIALTFNEFNLSLIKAINPKNIETNAKSTVYDETVFCIDNEYYLSPVVNFINGKGWKRSPALSNGDSFRRVPGYSILYYAFIKTFGFATGHKILKYFQLFLFAISVYCIWFIANILTKHKSLSYFISIIYGFTPIFYGWVYFTMTESITPYLMVFYLFMLTKARIQSNSKTKLLYYIIASFLIGYLTLTRPYTAIAGLIIIIYVFQDYYIESDKKLNVFIKKIFLIGLLPIIMICSWAIRNYINTGEIVFLEKAFHPQSLDRMKPEFKGVLDFVKCWGEDGPVFSDAFMPMQRAALKGDTNIIYLKNIINSWPKNIVNEYGYERLLTILKTHQNAILQQKYYFDNEIAMPNEYLPIQLKVQKDYHKLISEYKERHFINYWLISPMRYLKRMVLHSNTSELFIFQSENRTIKTFNIIRYLLVVIHITIYLSLFINLFLLKNDLTKIAYVYIPLLIIFFFVCIHREIEQRYMLPILPVIFVGNTSILIHKLLRKR